MKVRSQEIQVWPRLPWTHLRVLDRPLRGLGLVSLNDCVSGNGGRDTTPYAKGRGGAHNSQHAHRGDRAMPTLLVPRPHVSSPPGPFLAPHLARSPAVVAGAAGAGRAAARRPRWRWS